MTLEDFFTLNEMKDGLTVLSRVEELVSVMQKDQDSVLKNISDAARQWSTVASTLSATENQENLDHFIQLDGLYFLNRWLQEAQKCIDTSDSSVEESINALLGALKKLPIDNKKSVSSGIGLTVKNLFGHKSFRVQERARALFDSWNQGQHNLADHQDILKDSGCEEDRAKPVDSTLALESGCLEYSAVDANTVKGSSDEDKHVIEPTGNECQRSRSSDGSQSENVKDVKVTISNTQVVHRTTLSQIDKEDGFQGNSQGSSTVSTPCQESISMMGESSTCPQERTTSIEICSSPVPVEDNGEGRSLDGPELKDFTDDAKEMDAIKGIPDKFREEEMRSVSTSSGPELGPAADPANAQPSVTLLKLSVDDAKENDFCLKKALHTGLNDDLETSFSRKEDIRAVNDVKVPTRDSIFKEEGGKDYATTIDVSKSMMDTRVSGIDKRSEMELEYGVDDALEVARQVAREVEREMEDYRKQFCSSSSEKNSEDRLMSPSSPDSINSEQDQPVTGPQNETPSKSNLPSGFSSPNVETHLMSPANTDKQHVECMHETDSSQVTEAVQEPAYKTEKGLCNFDLNEEVCSEEMDRPWTPRSSPITVVSASKAAAPGLRAAPLHFGGELGWKGSAATSAFRPASPRRTPEGEKMHSVERSNQSSKLRRVSDERSNQSSKLRMDLIDVDLNVAMGEDDGVRNPQFGKQIAVSSDLPSGESSIEVSSRRAEHHKLDLNLVGDYEDAPSSGWKSDGQSLHHRQNGSSSPASSSSSLQPSKRNIDLNDFPSFCDDLNDKQTGLGKCSSLDRKPSGGFKIMGTTVEVNGKEFVHPTPPLLPNRQITEIPAGSNIARSGGSVGMRSGMTYTSPHSVFGYNGLTTGSMTFAPATYGPGYVPYMADSRGAYVVPQIMGSPAVVPPSYSRPQTPLSMTGPLMGYNGAGNAPPGLDLNSGLTVVEAENGEPRGLRQLFVPGQGMIMEDQMRSVQPPNSGIGAKRKEPDGGWDQYPFGYKHRSPWP